MISADTSINFSLILSIISCIGVIVAIAQAFKKDSDAKTSEKLDIEKNFVKINVKLDNFCEQTKQILKNQEKSSDELRSLSEEIVKNDERIQTLFKHYEDHEERIKKLEEKIK